MTTTWNGATAPYAALLALWWMTLTVRVIRARRAGRVSLGDGGDPALIRAVRAHGNASESIPLMILLMMLVEAAGLPPWLVHAMGLAAVLGRVLHGAYLWREGGPFGLRVAGMILTFAAVDTGALALLGTALAGLA